MVPRLKMSAIPTIIEGPSNENKFEPKRKLPNILKKPKKKQSIVSSESEIENSAFTTDSASQLKLVCINITKDNNVTISPLTIKNSILKLQPVSSKNISRKIISKDPVNITENQGIEPVTPFFDFIWNSPLKLSSASWSLVKVANKDRYISIGRYILNVKGVPYAQRQVLLNEDLTIKYIINGRILENHTFLNAIQSLQQLEEAILNIDLLKICSGGPSIEEYPPDLYTHNKKKHVDNVLNVWRHNECTLIIPKEKKNWSDCYKCKTLTTILIAQTKNYLERKSEKQINKNKDQLIRRLKTKVNRLKHSLKELNGVNTRNDDVDKMEEFLVVYEEANNDLKEEKVAINVKPVIPNSPSAKELKDKKLRDKIDKWKKLECEDQIDLDDIDELDDLDDDDNDDDDDDDDDEMNLEESLQNISKMKNAKNITNIETRIKYVEDDEEMDFDYSSSEFEPSTYL